MNTDWIGRLFDSRGLGSKRRCRRTHDARRTSHRQRRRSSGGCESLEDRRLLVASLSINDPMVTEGDAGSLNLDFTVARGGDDTLSSVTFSFATSDNSPAPGAATAGVDYTATSGTVTIPSGNTSATISVPVLGDTVFEGDEELFVDLTGITNVTGPATSFAAKQDFATGDAPRSVSVGDLNGDGRPDLAVANRFSDTVTVLLNQPATITDSRGTGTIMENDPPETTIDSASDGDGADLFLDSTTLSDAITVTFSGSVGVTDFECRLDQDAFRTCTSPTTYGALLEGTHYIEVRAIDAAGNTDPTPASLSWQIQTPVLAIEELIDTVIDFNLQHGIENSLVAKLDSAFSVLDDLNANNDVSSVNLLEAFINAVEAQRGKKITDEQADELITDTQAIIDELMAQFNDW